MLNENKQVKAANGGGTLGEYWYDGDGKRVKKTTNTSDNVIFIYDAGGRLIEERSSSSPYTLLTSYVYAGGRLLSTETSSGTKYLTTDHLGSPRINTDGSGNVVARHDYHPFGEEIDGTGGRTTGLGYPSGSDGIRQQFTGYERDNEIELDFAQARYYRNNHGRFSSPDPYNIVLESQAEIEPDIVRAKLNNYLASPQQWNRFLYVLGNPLKYVDPTGEILELTGTQEERDRAFKRLEDLVGKDAGLAMHTAGGRTFVIYSNQDNLRKSAGDVGQVVADIIASKSTVEFQITTKNEVTNAKGEKINLADRLATTELISSSRMQIFIKEGSAGTLQFKMRNEWDAEGSWNRLKVTDSVMDANELGHAWGAIKDGTYNKVMRSNARHYSDPRRENNNRALQVENWQRSRLGLSRRASHP